MLCFEFFSLFPSPLSPWYMHFLTWGCWECRLKPAPEGYINQMRHMAWGWAWNIGQICMRNYIYIYISLKWGAFGQALKQCFSAQCCCGRHPRLLLISKCPVSFWEVLKCKLEHFASQILIHLSSVTNWKHSQIYQSKTKVWQLVVGVYSGGWIPLYLGEWIPSQFRQIFFILGARIPPRLTNSRSHYLQRPKGK